MRKTLRVYATHFSPNTYQIKEDLAYKCLTEYTLQA